jgi:cytochrome b561
MQNEILCIVSKFLWVVAIIVLINVGLMPFGYNMFQTDLFLTTLDWAVAPIHYIAGIAGLLGLYRLIMKLVNRGSGSLCGCSGSGACPCGRPNCNCR